MPVALPPVLVVDDEKNMRLSLQAMLGDEGYEARAVESAEEALNHASLRITGIRKAAAALAIFPERGTLRDDVLSGARHLTIDRAI